LSDAFAPGANYNDKNFMALLKGLKKGDVVTIMFTTDSERHRIMALRKKWPPQQNLWVNPGSGSFPSL